MLEKGVLDFPIILVVIVVSAKPGFGSGIE